MVRITIEKGKWKDMTDEIDLVWENCPNPNCKNERLHYPDYMYAACCPDCKESLKGANLNKSAYNRAVYHRS